MNRIFFLLFLLGGLALPAVRAQVLPPNLICVSNDTLFWELPPTNNCGAFQGYVIFAAQQPNGNFSELAVVTDPTQTRYFHMGSNAQTWYYYLITRRNCPGQTALPSDTLDNRIPLAGPIRSASVDSQLVRLTWDASPSPEVVGYVISRNTPNGTVILDTVLNATTYTDRTADPQRMSETYFVTAVDACGNNSLVVDPHHTILLQTAPPDSCAAGVVLTWNAYEDTRYGVTGYTIFAAVDGGAFAEVGQVGAAERTYTYTRGNDGETICFYVEARLGSGERARSSTSCETIDIVQPLRRIELLTATVRDDGMVTLEWLWDGQARLGEANLMRAGNIRLPLTTTPGTDLVTFTDETAMAAGEPLRYRVTGRDICGNSVESNTVETIALSGTPGNTANRLEWTPFVNELVTGATYELVRVEAVGETVVFTDSATTFSYEDTTPAAGADASGFCYYVRATLSLVTADSQALERTVRSNTVCLKQRPKIFFPNAFAPRSLNELNNVFRPFLPPNLTGDYTLDIYDRWGGQVFHSEIPEEGWNGKVNGREAPSGVYFYRLRLTQTDGTIIEETGDVALIR